MRKVPSDELAQFIILLFYPSYFVNTCIAVMLFFLAPELKRIPYSIITLLDPYWCSHRFVLRLFVCLSVCPMKSGSRDI